MAFNGGLYFEAHELWEEVWLALLGPERTFAQGLIQVAAGMHHLARHRRGPAAGLLQKGLGKISRSVPASLSRPDVEDFARGVEVLLARLEAGASPSSLPSLAL